MKLQWIVSSLLFTALALIGNNVAQDSKNSSSGRTITLAACSVVQDEVIEVPAQVSGVITNVNVHLNERIAEGFAIAKIDDTKIQFEKAQLEAKHALNTTKAQRETFIKEAKTALSLAQSELARTSDLFEKGSSNIRDLDAAKQKVAQAEAKLEVRLDEKVDMQAELQIEDVQLQALQDMISRYEVTSPRLANIKSLEKNPGEYVREGDVIATLVVMDTLHVVADIRKGEYNREDVYQKKVTVEMVRARGEKVYFDGYVSGVDLSQKDDTFMIDATVVNKVSSEQWILHPGDSVTMTIHLDQPFTVAGN